MLVNLRTYTYTHMPQRTFFFNIPFKPWRPCDYGAGRQITCPELKSLAPEAAG